MTSEKAITATTTTTATAEEEDKKKEEKSSKKKASAGKHHHKKKDDSAAAPGSPKKEKSSKKTVEAAPNSPSKKEKSKKKSKPEKSAEKSPPEQEDDKGVIAGKVADKSSMHEERKGVQIEEDDDTKKMIDLLTQDIWSATTAQDTATVLQKLCTMLQESSVTTTVSIELGAPLLVARKMNEYSSDTAVQMEALQLWHHWTSASKSSASLSSWYRLFVRVGGLAQVLECLVVEGQAETEENTNEQAWKGVHENAMSLLGIMISSPEANLLLIQYEGIETLGKFYRQGHQNKNKETLLPRVTDILYQVATASNEKGYEKVITELASLMQEESTEPGAVSCQTGILDIFGKLMQAENEEDPVATFIQANAWGKIQDILTLGSTQRVDAIPPEMASLQDKAMGLYEKMAAANPATAELLVQNKGVETLKCIVQGKNGALIPRALELLFQLSATTGTAARGKITEEMGEVLRDSRHEMLQTAIISLLSEMANDEETAKGLLKGQGVESLVYTWETYRNDRLAVSDKALDLLVLLAAKGGTASRQAIIDSGFLNKIATVMKEDLANDTIHTRGRQLAQALAGEHGAVVDETGILAA